MKKLLAIILLFIVCVSPLLFSAIAASSASIGGNDIIADNEKYQTVPVYLSNNPGIMGFKISIEYPDGVEVKNISRGTLSEKGNFATNLENHSENRIDIIWNDTDNVSEDGSIFILNIKAPTSTLGEELKISYSQEDTFNEKWDDVALFCTGMSIVTKEQGINTTISETISDKDYSYIKEVIETELENCNSKSISKIPKEKQNIFLDSIKEKLIGVKINTLSDVEKLYNSSLKNEFESSVSVMIEPESFISIIDKELKNYNIRSFEELEESKKDDFIKTVVDDIKSDCPDLSVDFEKLNSDDKLESIKKVYDYSLDKIESDSTNQTVFVIISLVFVATVIVTIVIVLKKKRCEKNGKKNNDMFSNSDYDNC